MAEKKRKSRDENRPRRGSGMKKRRDSRSKTLTTAATGRNKNAEGRKRTGPRLPSQLRKEVAALNPNRACSDDDVSSDGERDVYEYEEGFAEEESKKNRRFDPVDNYEYELPDEFEDENVPSDDEDDDDEEEEDVRHHEAAAEEEDLNQHEEESEEEDAGRHVRMLQGITGLPPETFEGKKRTNNVVITEPYPESEYNPSRDVLDGDGRISIQDLLDPLHGMSGYSKLRKRIQEVEKKSLSVPAPLPKMDQERLERKAAYEHSKKDITKWEPLVKKNREAPTIFFDEDVNLGFSTVGAIASGFEPRTDFEKKMASLFHDDKVVEAHRNDGARLLELNKISVEDVKDRQNQLAKMRSLLFLHETKAKRIKKIKSKTYHRLLKKGRTKAATLEMQDPEAAKELAMKQEFKRAKERMTLKHKNSSKWAKRIIKRGLNAQDEGTRAAISEQLHLHALLRRKMNSMKDGSSSSDDSSDDDDDDSEISAGSDEDGASRLLAKAKYKTLKVAEEEDEVPKSGVLALPFMVRGLKKNKEAANEEARLALEEFESSLKQLEGTGGAKSKKVGNSSGRRVFNAATKQVEESSKKIETDNSYRNSDSEDDILDRENIDIRHGGSNDLHRDVKIDANVLREESEIGHDPMLMSFKDMVSVPGPKTTYEVAICASDSSKKMERKTDVGATAKRSSIAEIPLNDQGIEEGGADSDTDSGGEMVDGILSSGAKPTYELPSQAELIQRAFAGDDVEEDFEKDKREVLNEENPEPEELGSVPGWGQWTDVQRKRGPPSWIREKHKIAKKKMEEDRKKRKDSHLEHVIISERLDKKAEKLHAKTLPFPFTCKETFEQSMRMPIAPESNPAMVADSLTRPEVMKKPGMGIKPIQLKDVNPYDRSSEEKAKNKSSRRKTIQKAKKAKANKRKS